MLIISLTTNIILLMLFLHKWHKNTELVNSIKELKTKLSTVTNFAERLLKNRSMLSQKDESND